MPSTTEPTGFACRVCGEGGVASLPIGAYAPFFRLRVDTRGDRHAIFTRRHSLAVLPSGSGLGERLKQRLMRLARRLSGASQPEFLRTGCNFCQSCRSITPSHEFSYGELEPLYADYRSARYNADRISVEPSYREIAPLVGQHPTERSSRNTGVASFLAPFLPDRRAGLALDLGGSDGRFIPHEVLDHYLQTHILDASDAPVHESLTTRPVRKVARADPAGYQLLMCMHVLEHVGHPRAFVLDAMSQLQPEGLIYLEVPLELQPQTVAQFEARLVDEPLWLHEHINQYDSGSLSQLVRSIDTLRLLAAEHAPVDCGWTQGIVSRVLAQRVD